MKRDLDLIRKLILALEEHESDEPFEQCLEGYTEKQIGYHSYLIVDAGLAEGVDVSTLQDILPQFQLLHLTAAGHDFAEAARNETAWSKARSVIAEKGGGATIDVVKQVLIGILRNSLGV